MPIVVGFVPTLEGHAALRRAAQEAELRQTSVIVVGTHYDGQEKDKNAAARFEGELSDVAQRLNEAGLEHEVRIFDRNQLPSEDIIDVAEEVNADFIVIGLRQRSAVGKLILGSHAQQILMNATCPVISVKATRF